MARPSDERPTTPEVARYVPGSPEANPGEGWTRSAAAQGALVWWTYGVIETALLVGLPRARTLLAAVFPNSWPAWPLPFVGPLLTAVLLLAYPAVGAALTALAAGATARTPLRTRLGARSSTFWSAFAEAAIVVAFAANVVWSGQRPVLAAVVLPALLALVRMRLALRPKPPGMLHDLTHPVAFAALLLGVAFVAQPRPIGPGAFPVLVASGCAALLVLFVAAVFWFRRLSALAGLAPDGWGGRLGAFAVSFALVAATLPLGLRPSIVRRNPPLPRRDDSRPNVVLVTWDAVRADHLSLYGYTRDTTPFLRQLASDGAAVFTNAVATSNWTLPTHASLFTGQPPIRHGANRYLAEKVVSRISGTTPTLAEVLSRAGYRTGGIAANSVVLVPEFGFDRGFDLWDSTGTAAFFPLEIRPYLLRGAVRSLLSAVLTSRDPEARFASADEINRRALRFLEESSSSRQPFFLFLNYMDAHDPYVPPRPYADRYPGRDERFRWVNLPRLLDWSLRLARPLTDRERAHLTSQYDGAIAWLDDRLRALVGDLRRLGLYDDTLIVVTADHGEALGESGLLLHGASLYQHQLHVPLVVKLPHGASRPSSGETVSGLDVFPTILEAAGVAVPDGIEGRSLFLARSGERRFIFSESYEDLPSSTPAAGRAPTTLAAFSGSLKTILHPDGRLETYDLSKDPRERRDLGTSAPPANDLNVELSRYLRPAPEHEQGPPVDPEAIARLRALGYIN